MANVQAWTNLSGLISEVLPVAQLLTYISARSRDETVFTLARIAGDLANANGGALGDQARAWTHDLLKQSQDSENPLERAISRAVSKLPPRAPIAHAHAVYVLQLLAVIRGTDGAPPPSDAYLAFLMLSINDHIPEWPQGPATPMTDVDHVLAWMFLCSVFNRSDDPFRFIVRVVGILACAPVKLPSGVTWKQVEEEAFGTSFRHYAESFLVPILFSSKTWGRSTPPVIFPQTFEPLGASAALYGRWFSQASMPIEEAAAAFATRPLPSGLYGLPASFFRTPFLAVGDRLVGLSPWHVRDHVILGTWAKLNRACKKLLRTNSNQVFSSEWGAMFERWCAELATEAAEAAHATERLILPSRPGASDEIEDVIFQDGDTVALLSAKASLVPEANLKSADSPDAAVAWLQRFFFEDPDEAKKKAHRGGALYLLDKKVALIRSGALEARGISRTAVILPCIVSFDNVGESGVLYLWLEEQAHARELLFRHGNVRPMTVITPEDYEALLALRARGSGICEMLLEKTTEKEKHGALDHFLHRRVQDSTELRLPSMAARFEEIVGTMLKRMEAIVARERSGTSPPP
jgi:hypothetical protein